MLLKDCPVGSMVRLSLFEGKNPDFTTRRWWEGNFEVFNNGTRNYVIDKDGMVRDEIHQDEDYQFKIVSNMQLTLSGVTYNLTPVVARKTITIDGVAYEMEEVR